ncbi:MAG TPA: hypothetical protein VD813_05290, partial [Pseudonocardia sp.]|nr:hypothetical protein [Pseudonocardia sp.]
AGSPAEPRGAGGAGDEHTAAGAEPALPGGSGAEAADAYDGSRNGARYQPQPRSGSEHRPAVPGPPPETLAQLSTTERELLARLHAELAAREARPRASRTTGMGHRTGVGQQGASATSGHGSGEPPDLAG